MPEPLWSGANRCEELEDWIQTQDICKQHLREKYPEKLGLVEEFIVEIEGPPNNCVVTRWGKFTDIGDIKKEIFQRLEVQFENWLNS